VLPDKIAYLTKKSKQHIATANDNFFLMEHISFEFHNKIFNALCKSCIYVFEKHNSIET